MRVQDLLDEKILRQKIEAALEFKNQVLVKVYNRKALDVDEVTDTVLAQGEKFAHRIADTRLELNKALERGETVLLEGSQGTLLDVDHGTYPFVTSSNPTAGGASAGSGIGPGRITTVLGILKAYTTRVGSGPFPTELHDEAGENLRKAGGEFGVTTGRSRRTGWFDAVIGRYAARVNGITDYFLTKLDVLSGLERIPVCVAYEVDGRRVEDMPMTQTDFHHAVPIYEELPGWQEDISGCRDFDELPANARTYVERLEELMGARISAIGVGPGREQTIVRHEFASRPAHTTAAAACPQVLHACPQAPFPAGPRERPPRRVRVVGNTPSTPVAERLVEAKTSPHSAGSPDDRRSVGRNSFSARNVHGCTSNPTRCASSTAPSACRGTVVRRMTRFRAGPSRRRSGRSPSPFRVTGRQSAGPRSKRSRTGPRTSPTARRHPQPRSSCFRFPPRTTARRPGGVAGVRSGELTSRFEGKALFGEVGRVLGLDVQTDRTPQLPTASDRSTTSWNAGISKRPS